MMITTMNIRPAQFQKYVLTWFAKHGRKHLPWQQNKTPYRVWISEIMLQQTQVNTVIPYYQTFMREFPDIKTLANASQDRILHLWAGLGYYSRARNLHKAAKMIMEDFHGKFPDTLANIQTLPGIGPSTAGAIFSLAFNQPAAILDGNVKRVLARFHAITEPVKNKTVETELWKIANHYIPKQNTADYTQAMMDIGATICIRGKPHCTQCPLQKSCAAHKQNIAHLLPAKSSSKILPVRAATFLIIQNKDSILLHKRPPMGIWGGLWSLPEIAGEPDKETILNYCKQKLKIKINEYALLAAFKHTFSHYHLNIHPVVIKTTRLPTRIMEDGQEIWYNTLHPESLGLPKPIQLIMRAIT